MPAVSQFTTAGSQLSSARAVGAAAMAAAAHVAAKIPATVDVLSRMTLPLRAPSFGGR